MQAGRNHVGGGGNDNAAGLDEKRGHLGGGKRLFKEGNGGSVGGMILSKQGRRRLSASISDEGISIGLEEKL